MGLRRVVPSSCMRMRPPFATTLHENVDRIPILINRTPAFLPLSFNGDEHLVDPPHTGHPGGLVVFYAYEHR